MRRAAAREGCRRANSTPSGLIHEILHAGLAAISAAARRHYGAGGHRPVRECGTAGSGDHSLKNSWTNFRRLPVYRGQQTIATISGGQHRGHLQPRNRPRRNDARLDCKTKTPRRPPSKNCLTTLRWRRPPPTRVSSKRCEIFSRRRDLVSRHRSNVVRCAARAVCQRARLPGRAARLYALSLEQCRGDARCLALFLARRRRHAVYPGRAKVPLDAASAAKPTFRWRRRRLYLHRATRPNVYAAGCKCAWTPQPAKKFGTSRNPNNSVPTWTGCPTSSSSPRAPTSGSTN